MWQHARQPRCACAPIGHAHRAANAAAPPVLVCVSTCTHFQAPAALGVRLAMCARSSTPRTAPLGSPQTLPCGARAAACSGARP